MTTAGNDPRQVILDLEPRLLECALGLTGDAARAQAVVDDTLRAARSQAYGANEATSPEIWAFRLLRQRFHAVGRDGSTRRERRAARERLEVQQQAATG